ncbi:excalibur calcium-binding domain-containing protein [Amaricoccus sp. W119]|uniref:excalibur calcium-binding domain-containing protein n=1 Tax=Amaricoccus sp. W119 TaxID=3391833 RepID=UPI0039A70129
MRGLASGVLCSLLLAGCAPSAPPVDPRLSALSDAYAAESNETLWKRQATTADSRELMMVEAELGTRGQLADANGRYLGSRTAAGVGMTLYSRPAPTNVQRNCGDFPSAAAAQRAFLTSGGPGLDPDNLDGDGDGYACGWGTQILSVSNRYQDQPGAAPRSLAPLRVERSPAPAVTRVAATRAPVIATRSGGGSYGAARTYHRGPRGGCFYYAATSKVYVDRDLCG